MPNRRLAVASGRPGAPGTLALVIPSYRAAATLPGLLARARRTTPGALVVVVDDGSHDGTDVVARDLGAVVRSHRANLGKGRALATGLETALAAGAELIVTLDADAQHPPEAVPLLLAPIVADRADLVVGARRRERGRMPLRRRLTNWLSSTLLSRALGFHVPDSQSGFRAMRAAVAAKVRPAGVRYEYETEFLFLAAARGFRIAAVPVATVYAGAPSHFRGGADTLAVAAVLLRYWRPILWGPRPT